MNIIPLHESSWRRLQEWRATLPHALLFSGPRGLGKVSLATTFAAGLFCEAPRPDGLACGKCLACRWFEQGNHPDFRLLMPESLRQREEGSEGGSNKSGKEGKSNRSGQEITIDQVRALDDFFAVGTHRQGLRIILAHPAEKLNRNAANALLKILEEPPPSTLFLLVSSETMLLLPTLRSRCQNLPIPVPKPTLAAQFLRDAGVVEAENWLALAGGAPGLAQQLAEKSGAFWMEDLVRALAGGRHLEVLASAAALEKTLKAVKGENPLPQLIDWAQKWLIDLNLAAQGMPIRFYLQQRAKIATLAQESQPIRLARFYRQLLQWRRESEHPLNIRLFLEQFFFGYRALFTE
ncbi:MAG: DNA polymerase III subunit delta' [Zoogloeaceae bacterium]|jgi:DNA polymerase-3 subunit delta'|nr:DNA polymerase III subunit delta' [Zoogloeaceae bacterium]